MNHDWEAQLWDSLDPPSAVTSSYGDIVIIAYHPTAGGEPVTVTSEGWTPGVAPEVAEGPRLLWRQDTGEGMPFHPAIDNPSARTLRWAVVRIMGVTRAVGTVTYARIAPPSFDFLSVAHGEQETLLALIRLIETGFSGTTSTCSVLGNLITEPRISHGYPTHGIVRTLTPGVDYHPQQPISGIGTGISGNITARTQTIFFVATWGPPLGIEAPRIRSHVSEDAGSLFQATQAVAVESAVSEAFPYDTPIPAGVPRIYREALTPEDVAIVYHPIPTRNQEMLVTVEGETNLGRMARVYPSAIVTRAVDVPGAVDGRLTAQQAIQHVFDRWASEFAWFRPLPVPDLRLLVGEAVAAPRQYYIDNPEAGVLTTEAIVIPQDGDDRRTMREIVDEWLAIFPGTIVRQDSQGRVELVPRVGPDAPDDAAVTLGWRDIISMSDGEDDPRGVVNRARCVSQGWTFEEDQALTPPLYVLGLRSDGLQESALEEVVDDLTSERLADGGAREFETFAEPDKPLTIEWRFRVFTAGTPTSTSLTTEVDLNGSFQMQQTAELEVSWFIFGVDNEKTRVRFTRQGNGIRARFDQSGRWRFGPNPFVGTRYAAYVLEFTVAGTGWVRANEQVVGEFSSSNGDFLPDVDDPGRNALEVSESLFGEREATIHSSVFHLTPEQAQAVAQGHVLFNINPRTIRDVQQSEWNRYPVKFDHIGRLVDLPNGERAVIENRSYSDSFAPDGGFMQSTFTATVTELAIDTTTEYLHLDDGNYMQLDDGTLVEAS